MRKALLPLILTCLLGLTARASHIYGGEMAYETVGVSPDGSIKTYKIILTLFRDNLGGGAQLPTQVWIGVFDYGTKVHYPTTQTHYIVSVDGSNSGVNLNVGPCVTGDISGNYSRATYTLLVDLPANTEGYIASYETCCRVNGLANVYHPGTPGGGGGQGVPGTGSTYAARIPGSRTLDVNEKNNSPRFTTALDLVCFEKPFTWDFSAKDANGDRLEYSFVEGYDRTNAENSGNVTPTPPNFSAPDYRPLVYLNGYTAARPLGARVSINRNTGLISGTAPPIGKYVVAVLVKEFRNNVLIAEHRKDFILRVQDCNTTNADLKPEYSSCDGFTFNFSNEAGASGLERTYLWDFGIAGRDDDFSDQARPAFTFSDTGVYTVKLVINRGDACADSAFTKLNVFPGFFPAFASQGICVNKPTQFLDQTRADYGVVNKWEWDFGDNTEEDDISVAQNPRWTYSTLGSKNVRLIVSSSKGCSDTISQRVDILDRPPLTLAFPDTLICRGDNLQLSAFGQGTFTWTPGTAITNANTATPTVSPVRTTSYFVELDQQGCKAFDSVRVNVVDFVTLNAMPDTVICATDPVRLRVTSDGLRYAWTPAATLDNASLKFPLARPAATTDYTVTATIGGCSASDAVRVTLVPYPGANAGRDTLICYNTSAQLNGSIRGASFSWAPAATLSNPGSLTPVARPRGTTAYVLTVRDNLGCPKPGRDTVIVSVLPEVIAFAGNDTSAVVGQPLQLGASGGENYVWTPATGLSNPNDPNPVGTYDGSFEYITYHVEVTDLAGCRDVDSVRVRIFKTNPQIFVPSAFTPNGDGKNDRFRFEAAGITKVDYFRVFNRWGQLVYDSPVQGRGWDGRLGGVEQASGTYVWMVKGTDFTGKVVAAKGTMVLIR